MTNLDTYIGGVHLKNPFIVSSCNLTNTPEKNRRWEDAGVGAVVLKSLFEEEIEAEADWMQEGIHTEEWDYLKTYQRAHRLEEYFKLVRDTKSVCTIPVIASINCFRLAEWTEFAKQIEQAGADALELNIMSVCSDLLEGYGAYERRQVEIVKKIKESVTIPVFVKLGKNLTNPLLLVHQLYANGASGIVMFNRMVNPDISLKNMTYAKGEILGTPSDLCEPLRWVGLASHQVSKMTYILSGGVADGASMVKAFLVGASAVEVCSALYREGAGIVKNMLSFVEEWMEANGYERISEFRGMMNAGKTGGGTAFERSQFFKTYGKYE